MNNGFYFEVNISAFISFKTKETKSDTKHKQEQNKAEQVGGRANCKNL